MMDARVLRRWLWRAAAIAAGLLLAVQLWFFAWIAYWSWANPADTAFMRHELAHLRKKNPTAQLRQQWVPYEKISANLKRAVVSAEDARFLEHEGVDWEAVHKAYELNKARGRPARGGSTISQQLAKNLFLSGERTYLRKAQELALTYMIELVWSKRRILEVYLNVVEWGDGLYGAEAAAHYYYGVSAAQLGPEPAARMAAFLPSPKHYGRVRTGGYLDGRVEVILHNMNAVVIP